MRENIDLFNDLANKYFLKLGVILLQKSHVDPPQYSAKTVFVKGKPQHEQHLLQS